MRLALHVKDISLVNQPMRCTHYKGAICECNPNWKVLFLFVLLWMRVFTKIESWNECCCSSSSSSSTLVSFVIVFMLTRSSFSQFFDHILCILHLTWLDSARLDLTRLYLCCLLFNLRVCVVLCSVCVCECLLLLKFTRIRAHKIPTKMYLETKLCLTFFRSLWCFVLAMNRCAQSCDDYDAAVVWLT